MEVPRAEELRPCSDEKVAFINDNKSLAQKLGIQAPLIVNGVRSWCDTKRIDELLADNGRK
jgi:hypothetical protein